MAEFENTKLRRLDLTVLLIFLALLRTRKAALAAEEFGLTPSSISHALGRLRSVFEDELFLRKPHGLEPTAFALQIEPQIRRAVEAANAALSGGGGFDPSTSDATIRLAALDSALAVMIPQIQSALAVEAPGVTLQALPIGRPEAEAALKDGALDIAIGVFPHHGEDFVSAPLYRDTYLVAGRRDHPLLDGKLTMERFVSARHLLVAPRGDLTGVVDHALKQVGQSREIALILPQFLPAFAILESSDLIAVLPTRLVHHFALRFNLSHQQPPLAIRDFGVSAIRHRRNAKNALHLWMLEKLIAAV